MKLDNYGGSIMTALKRQTFLAWLAGIFFLLATLIFSITAYVFWFWKPVKPLRGSFTGTGAPVLTAEEKQTIVTKARMLRTKWRTWASAHRAELLQLRNASATEGDIAFAVYDLIPANPTRAEDGLDHSDISEPPFFFTWTPGTKESRLPENLKNDKHANRMLNSEKFYCDEAVRNGFQKYRDIPLATSVNFGQITYTLWASGRIIENVGAKPDGSTRNSRNEIESPFDFLR